MSLGLMTVLLWTAAGASRAADVAPEPQLKAEFIERISRFVEWPDASFPDEDSPFTICIIGDNPFGDYLVKMARDRRIQNRKIVLARVSDPARLTGCNLLFVSSSEDKRLDKILTQTDGRPVLTVGDTNGYAARGVLVNFYRDGDKIRFEINKKAVDRSGLHFSSKILRLARMVGKP